MKCKLCKSLGTALLTAALLSGCGGGGISVQESVLTPASESRIPEEKIPNVDSAEENGIPEETGKEEETAVEEYIPHTEPQLRKDGGLYTYASLTALCTTAGQDKEFLYRNNANVLDYCRFADGNASLIYLFDLHGCVESSVTLKIGNNYKIEVSPDAKTWTKVYDWLDDHKKCNDRSNEADYTFNPYDYEVYEKCYVRLTDSDPSDGWGACIAALTFSYYEEIDEMSLNIFGLEEEDYKLLDTLDHTTVEPAPVETYKIADDGGLIYNPISREKAAQLTKYADAEKLTGSIETESDGVKYTLTYSVPKNVTAYDAVPVEYTVTSSEENKAPVYINTTAFEDKERENGNFYYDLTLPGKVDVTWEYLGYVRGHDDYTNRAKNTSDPASDKQGKQYPQYDASELIYSGSVKSDSLLWWKFRFTNTGDTILDGDGNGTFCFEGVLYRKNRETKQWDKVKGMENLFNRIIDEVYPGESGEMYFIFDNAFNLPAGEYKIVINGLVRNETTNPENYEKNIWGGETYTASEFAFDITENDEITDPGKVRKTLTKKFPTRNRWMHTYEEFMTSYDSHLNGTKNGEISGTMYLQCAPWTNQVVLRLIIGNGDNLAAVSLPVEVESDSVTVKFNPENNNYVVLDDGTRFPAISAQSMADMRGNVQLGPDAAGNIIGNFLDMKDCGVNLINTTAAFEYDSSFGKNRANNIDACWFSLDAARVIGLALEGWITYPYENAGSLTQANQLFGTALSETGHGSHDLAVANGLNTVWQYKRWGDNYWIGGDETVVIDVEDTRGWMRVDFNARFRMDEASKQNFRLFLMDRYSTIDALNADWGSDYKSFDEIDPEKGTTDDHGWASYRNKRADFSEWSRPLEVLDQFRTLERIQDYKWVLDTTAEDMPTAKINVRTEGANWICAIDPNTDNAHFRHVYYSQRRCGLIAELMGEADVLYSSSDYTTLPYTPSEVAELTRASVENGIVPMMLPQFDRMRDIAVNEKYGTSFVYEYNLDETAEKGAYINTVCSVFEWFRATYENGGVPGILWQDYLCDGYATATQRKEIAFFTEKLKEAMETPEGRAWAENFSRNESVLDGSWGSWSFDREYVESLVKKAEEQR